MNSNSRNSTVKESRTILKLRTKLKALQKENTKYKQVFNKLELNFRKDDQKHLFDKMVVKLHTLNCELAKGLSDAIEQGRIITTEDIQRISEQRKRSLNYKITAVKKLFDFRKSQDLKLIEEKGNVIIQGFLNENANL